MQVWVCPSAMLRPEQSSLRWPRDTCTAVCHCKQPPLRSTPLPTAYYTWWIFTHSKNQWRSVHILLTLTSQDPFSVSVLFPHLNLEDLQQKGKAVLIDAQLRWSNVVWSFQAIEMSFKWSSTQGFVISLIKFAGNPLPHCHLYMEK